MKDAFMNDRRLFLKVGGAASVSGLLLGISRPMDAEVSKSNDASRYDVKAFGASGDGKTLDTAAINQAIETCAKAGGGTLVFPAGSYLCHSIHLRSNVALQLEQGSTIVAADASGGHGYDVAESNKPWEAYQDFGHNHWHNSLLWGEGLENVSITGPGLIWGKGLSRGWEKESPLAETPGVGNKAIALKNCRNVLLRDFSILHGGHFGILATGVDNLTIDNLKIDTNRDGMDIDCCRNVRVSNCSVNSPWDDGICLKSSFGLGYARATEMVTITNCFVTGTFEEGTLLDASFKRFASATDAPRTGRIKFGTEANGGFKNITVSNCVFEGCRGLALESVDGALLEDVTISNITMRDVSTPIFMRLGARMRGPEGVPVGAVRRVIISNLVCSDVDAKSCSLISGIPGHAIENVKLSNILIQHRGGGTKEDATRTLEEKEKSYPEPNMFGTTPAQGFFIRHAQGIELSDVKIMAEKDDARPSMVLEDVKGANFSRMNLPKVTPAFVLRNVEGFSISESGSVPDTRLERVEEKQI
jgi:polygalacturonase